MDKKSPRVLLITPGYPPPPGGIQTVVRNIERGLRARNIPVQVVYIDPSDFTPSISDLLPRPRWCYSARATVTGKYMYQKTAYDQVTQEIADFEPDIVHALHVRNWSALVAANEAEVPTILSAHALELEETPLAQKAISAADAVHAVSEFTGSLVRKIRNEANVEVIHPSIKVEDYEKAKDSLSHDHEERPIVTVARFVERKNIETVIEAWKKVDNRLKQGRKLVLVGEGPKKKELKQSASDVEDIKFTGWIEERKKRQLLAESALFVMVPKQIGFDVEGFGIVYIEAQAAGTPVIGSQTGGVPEAVGEGGITVNEPGNPAEVANCIETLLDESTRQQYSRKAASRIDQFEIGEIIREHLESYRKIYTQYK
ncbi:glycosyltransferase family 4 protein [Halosimplex pelagicum]|uniref:Glycosyltransferase family 4 protein n=1 Tax=Halosimplex pelagicum TaxID=869886 RepID=A0A7D5T8T3_9EURY|nr:glycosyltransferase family 4 protein [Halosimplex pelagicum]QLH81270.1 glycosyltransferase family 4 protein [Halosimplex pelagicum]